MYRINFCILKILIFSKLQRKKKKKITKEEYFSTGKDEKKLADPIVFYANIIYIKITPLPVQN